MSGAVSYSDMGLRADRSDRLLVASEQQTTAGRVADAGVGMARLVSGGYSRMARFTEDSARTVQSAASARIGALPFDRVQAHMASATAAAREGVTDALRTHRVAYERMATEVGSRRKQLLSTAFSGLRGAAKVGGDLAALGSFATSAWANRTSHGGRTAFTAPPINPVKHVRDVAGRVGSRVSGMLADMEFADIRAGRDGLRRKVAAASLGVMMTAHMALDSLAAKTGRLARFFADGARTVSGGVGSLASKGLNTAGAAAGAVKRETADAFRHTFMTPHGRMVTLAASAVALVGLSYMPSGAEHLHGVR